MLTTSYFDKIRNQVTVKAFAIVFNGKVAAKMQVTRPARLRTGMESFNATLQIFRNASGEYSYSDAAGKAGGCGYDKVAAAMASAINAAGLNAGKAENGREYAPIAIAESLRLPSGEWTLVEF